MKTADMNVKDPYGYNKLIRVCEQQLDNAMIELEILGGDNAIAWVQKTIFSN